MIVHHFTQTLIIFYYSASLSEKRRIAALISWEKRRITAEKRANATATAPPTKGGKKRAMQKQKSQPVVKRSTTDMFRSKNSTAAKAAKAAKAKGKKSVSATSMTDIRREAARLGWERRKQMLSEQSSDPGSSSSDASSEEDEAPSSATSDKKKKSSTSASGKKMYTAADRRKAAKLGWVRRHNEKKKSKVKPKVEEVEEQVMDASEIRRQAAKLGWERRKKMLAAQSESSADSSDSEDDDEGVSSADETSSSSVKGEKKLYTASDRRQAAILGWQRRNNPNAARRGSTESSFTSDDVMAIVTAAPRKEIMPIKTVVQRNWAGKQFREGTKRSRRLAEDPSESLTSEEETRKVNELVTYLRMTRGWMEFHPSSRHGSGTATYGYIPASLATYIRDGTINQSTVLQLGTLGIHYALDWDGYGGLRDMIATFGEDYSPYPTEEMMEQSRIPEWELGEDLPLREVEEAEEKKLEEAVAMKEQDMEEMICVASILANLDRDAVTKEHEEEKRAKQLKLEHAQARIKEQEENVEFIPLKEAKSPSILALKGFNDSSSDDSQCNNSQNETPPSQKQSEQSMHDGTLVISPNVKSTWNFGLC